MTQTELEALARKWQQRLRLQDWTFDLRLCRFYDVDRDQLGECRAVLRKQMAIIKVLDPADYDPSLMGAYDPERTLVYELLHCRLLGIGPDYDDGSVSALMEEHAVHALATLLVEMDRASVQAHGADGS